MSKEKLLICVYGSLRAGMGNHRVIEGSKKLSTETVQIPFKMIDMGSYPGLLETEENNAIVIEIYEVTPDTYKRVERLEGYPSFYDRKDVPTSEGMVGIYYLPKSWGREEPNWVPEVDGEQDWVKHYYQKRSKCQYRYASN